MVASPTSSYNPAAMMEEEESVLPLDEQVNRPIDTSISQQRVNGYNPILDPEWMIYSFLILAALMIPIGFHLESLSESIVELTVVYDSINPDERIEECSIGLEYNANYKTNKTCQIQIQVPQDMEPPVLLYYQLTNFHQNHRFYVSSRDDFQLTGAPQPLDAGTQSSAMTVQEGNCKPLLELGGVRLNPCGLIANTFFNDKFTLIEGVDADGNDLELLEEGIAWTSDIEYRYKMPFGYKQEACQDANLPCDASCCQAKGFSCTEPAIGKNDSICYAYHYPHEDETQYLYETYPNLISPLEHVRNEHFAVWMRVATRPQFRKLYGYIQQPIPAGTILTLELELNYVVESFEGSKAIILTTNDVMGGKNPYLGPTLYGMGFFCLFCGLFFALKHWFRPRKIADPKYLHYKED